MEEDFKYDNGSIINSTMAGLCVKLANNTESGSINLGNGLTELITSFFKFLKGESNRRSIGALLDTMEKRNTNDDAKSLIVAQMKELFDLTSKPDELSKIIADCTPKDANIDDECCKHEVATNLMAALEARARLEVIQNIGFSRYQL